MTRTVPGSVTSAQCNDFGIAFGLSASMVGSDAPDLSISLRVEAGATIFGWVVLWLKGDDGA